MIKAIGSVFIENKLLAICIAFMTFLGLNILMWNFPITDFSDPVVSIASARDVDMKKGVLAYLLFVFPCTLILAYFIRSASFWHKITGFLCNLKWSNVDEFKVLLLLLACSSIAIERKHAVVFFLLVIFLLLIMFFRQKKVSFAFDIEELLVVWLNYCVAFFIPVSVIGVNFGIYSFAVYVIGFIAILLMSVKWLQRTNKNLYHDLFIYLMAGVVDCLLLTVFKILALHGVHITIVFLLIPYIVAYFYLKVKEKSSSIVYEYDIRHLYLVAIIFTVTAVMPLGQSGYIDFFEGANHGLSIYAFIKYGNLPILDNLDAHMLNNTLGGLVYYYLTSDYIGALFHEITDIIERISVMLMLIVFLKKYLPHERIFLLLSLFPWSGIEKNLFGFVALGLLIWWLNRPVLYRNIIIIIFSILLTLLRIDIGASFGLTLLFFPAIKFLCDRNIRQCISYVLSVALIFVMLFVLVQNQYKNIFVILSDILTAFSSNQHWGYGSFGANSEIKTFAHYIRACIVYFMLPSVIAVLCMPHFQRICKKKALCQDWLILFVYAVFIFSLPRAIARHSIIEITAVYYVIPAFLLIFLLLLKLNARWRTCIIILVFFLHGVLSVKPGESYVSLLPLRTGSLIHSLATDEEVYWKLNEADAEQIKLSKQFCDDFLKNDETYFDFTNQSLFFAFVNRHNPVYINQSPAMINSVEHNQQKVVNRLRSDMPRFVFMPYLQREGRKYGCYYAIDEILNIDRYFLLSEFISEYYRPFCKVGNFAVWCKQSEYDALVSQSAGTVYGENLLDYSYEAKDTKHNLGYIPYLWGTFPSAEFAKDDKYAIRRLDNEWIIENTDNVIGHKGFLVLTIDSANNTMGKITLYGKNMQEIEYVFTVKKGINIYRIRISSDWRWFNGNTDKIYVNSDMNANILNCDFLAISASEE